MRSNFTLLLLAFLLLATSGLALNLNAQCPGCTIDPTCATTLATTGGLCPAIVPDATVGEYYEESVTFFIPNDLVVLGFDVTVQSITIASIAGLPFDLEWECDQSTSGCFYDVVGGENTGCVNICGTPITAPGTYTIDVTVNATVFVNSIGINVTQPETYSVDLTVIPGTGTTTFSLNGAPDCADGFDVDFAALVDGSPNITKYNWDFGNGNTSTLATPPTQSYAAPGSYLASLETQICGLTLTEICATSLAAEAWCGDVEEPNWPFLGCTGDPDIYWVLSDASGNQFGGSGTEISNANTGTVNCWSGLNIQLSNPPYVLEIYDADTASSDDLLSLSSFTPSGTNQSFSGTAGNGNTTTGTLSFGTYVIQTFNDVATIGAYSTPLILSFANTDVSTSGGNDGAIDLTVSGGQAPYNYFWGTPGTMEDISGLTAGVYTVQVIDQSGCAVIGSTEVFEPPVICDCSDTVVQVCDDLDACTFNDVITIDNCNGSVCVPCQGSVLPCTATTTQSCDDGDDCTINDLITVDNCDGSICVPCQGTADPCNTTISQSCDDGDDCTYNDLEMVDICSGQICIPCEGISLPNNYIINGTINVSEDYFAQDWIQSDASIDNNLNVEFRAGDYIELLPDFESPTGADFRAHIEECP